ncbi:hypothetical protein NC651_018110 [Populus alba x Populus x berolinensis]|nr:hypothetical protein NC651_018110 [Populus alba x Populus x berolinensis]
MAQYSNNPRPLMVVEKALINFTSAVHLHWRELLRSIQESELSWSLMGVSSENCTNELAPMEVWRKGIEHVYQHLPHIIKTWGDVSHLNETGYLKSGFGGDETSG